MSLTKNVDFLRNLPKLSAFNGLPGYGRSIVHSPLVEINDFGSNPGALRMFSFVPEHLPRAPALVVVLHGCGQTAAGYDRGAGWSTLAERYGFALLMPEQQASNNGNTCFNWFNPEDISRDGGEAGSIRQMIARMVGDHHIDSRRIYVTGLSAGGAMTSVMLATYPDVFAGGAVIAGLPYGIAGNVREALSGMMQSPSRPADELGDLVRNASKHKGPWPKLSVWHGSADRTVSPGNADEIVKQWLDVHQLPLAPMSTGDVDGYPRQVWWNADGETVVESYTITDMAHGTPLGATDNDERYGEQGAFLIEAGISSSYHIANFFGLTDQIRQPRTAPHAASKAASKTVSKAIPVDPTGISRERAGVIAMTVPVPAPEPELATDLVPRATRIHHAKRVQSPRRRGIDVGEVITRALTAAGLMK
ncbi:PHB depolymerase family esterase [Bradyrhizobium sp. JYMT SZCCT0428]|uniref:extracellular catalytic domain type 1 short-chain-length polyhydroxyalkanoate depolymerase n=1 Tax=Bradyrhizobium sp. JYMT SZCCT0428 TaxID=2807673 RepID=UPI001BAE52BC|nr:PHB depolymerase family esterase [Bradyrhizobium sp. JYMT SZCCT0428]MBR1155935.1 PHB depolymerase family esterase [Bradyrhizobium sp. JYMT SZCCT0428]